eukprot:scaffold803_cov310-Pinguiococcus_pyrenoidosus.AAC.168
MRRRQGKDRNQRAANPLTQRARKRADTLRQRGSRGSRCTAASTPTPGTDPRRSDQRETEPPSRLLQEAGG